MVMRCSENSVEGFYLSFVLSVKKNTRNFIHTKIYDNVQFFICKLRAIKSVKLTAYRLFPGTMRTEDYVVNQNCCFQHESQDLEAVDFHNSLSS